MRSISTRNARSRGLPLSPEPRPLPFIGNVLDFPRTKQGIAFRDMCAQYGDILHFNLLGQHMLVLGRPDVVFELLDKRSANTSDRFVTPLIVLTGMDMNLSAMRYGERWRRHRRAFWQYFHPSALPTYQPMQRKAAHRFLNKLLKTPSRLREPIRFTFYTAVLEVLFGYSVADDGDEIMAIVEDALEWPGEAFTQGKYLIETLPILRYVPTWFPGATVQRLIVHWRSTVTRLKEEPYRQIKVSIAHNEAPESVVSNMITTMVKQDDEPSSIEVEDVIKNVAAVTVEGASDTMFSTVQTMFMAMALNPEIQKRAQAELDAVVGPHRLPDFSDQQNLVYVNATIREALWWQAVSPFSLPHVTVEDDEFRGYFLPAGSIILPNVWACTRNPELYEDPDVFRPERFVHDGKVDFTSPPDPALFVFGFGRRICPGRYFAENGLLVNVALILHAFDITPPADENGKPIALHGDIMMADGLLCYLVEC
ncbi:cytochrome P450 [Dichomitus squalens LYAD-421 SS1]|uniref:Cytochrome P450 n=1 Tax=Dichomitus squalens (strain LYAD-421) TaxID=732165 RepID=R7SND0_DICSQ|nr:cytochrome P450 [Dichomitus squalens LYAD-421 SS1]EJF57200.1 cytochrome P450 [Dichomitus squalens LYAD-421 SS1]